MAEEAEAEEGGRAFPLPGWVKYEASRGSRSRAVPEDDSDIVAEDRRRRGMNCESCSTSCPSSGSWRRCESVAGARGVVGVNRGVSIGAGSELRSIERSVARRVKGLTRAGFELGSEGDAEGDEVTMDMLWPRVAGWIGGWGWCWDCEAGRGSGDLEGVASGGYIRATAEGRGREEVTGELRTASRTGSKAGMDKFGRGGGGELQTAGFRNLAAARLAQSRPEWTTADGICTRG